MKIARAVVELKVIVSTTVATAVGAGVAVLNAAEAHHELLGSLPPTFQTLILIFGPGILTGFAGWSAKHTPRPDLGAPPPPTPINPPQT